jgi:hypothetical protein
MPSQDSEGDDGLDPAGVGSDYVGIDGESEGDHSDLFADLHEDDFRGDGLSRGADVGPGLTEPERELIDEQNRIRDLERARDRFESSSGLSALSGGGGGESAAERDAVAVIDAAGRFGLVETSEVDERERDDIIQALALHAQRDPKADSEYNFYAIIAKQATQGESILLTLKVPWEHREEVFRAIDTMPFSAMIRMTQIESMK